jgi:acylphosphatase
VEGLVQRGGFRYLVEELAFKLGITGQVENMPDKSVRIIGEGDETRLEELRQRIPTLAAPIIVTGIHPVYEACTGEFTSFNVIRDKDPAKESDERADRAIHLLGETIMAIRTVDNRIQTLDSHLVTMDSHISSVDSNVKSVDSNIKSMDTHIKSMDRNIGGHFERLDQKYDRFGSSLAQVADDIHEIKGDLRKAVAGRKSPKSA